MNGKQLTDSVVRVGVIGLGYAGETHLKAYRQLPNVRVIALAGLEEDKLVHLGTTYEVPHLYRHYEELLARDDLDAISICVPNYLHAPIALAAFEGGKHVLCEKPLARTGAEAEQITRKIERQVEMDMGRALPSPGKHAIEPHIKGRLSDAFRAPYLGRTLMLTVFNFFQTIGFYGFGNWVPSLLVSQGATVTHSLKYSFVIAIAYPIGPLLCYFIADRFERKWQIVTAAAITACFGLLFSHQHAAITLIACGVIITLSNNLLSYAYHAYQAELFPTSIRARAVGFVYSWSRLSTVLTSFMIGFFLHHVGSSGVFAFIATSMAVVIIVIGAFGPRTRGLSLEDI